MRPLDIRLFGGFDVPWHPRDKRPFRTQKTRALLVMLLLAPDQAHDRGALSALLWPDVPPKRASHSLRQALSFIRRAFDYLPLCPVVVSRQDVRFIPDAALCTVDALRFNQLTAANTIETLSTAADLVRGPLLAGFSIAAAPEFDTWLVTTQAGYQAQALRVLDTLAEHHLARAEYGRAQTRLQQALQLDPWHEAAHRGLMRAHAMNGDAALALAQYARCRDALAAGLGVEPLPITRALRDQIAGGELAPAAPAGTLPPLPFVGRGVEHAALAAALDAPAARLMLVSGPAGSGKSRLLQEFARYAQSRGSRVLQGSCFAYDAYVPYQPLLLALQPAVAEAAAALPAVWQAELARLWPALPGARLAPPSTLAAEDAARHQLFMAVFHLLTRLTATAHTLLILDDLHDVDASTLDLLRFLLQQQPDRLLIAGAFRPDETPPAHGLTRLRRALSRRRLVDLLPLAPLTPADLQQIARRLLTTDSGDAAAFLLRESEGNPFFLAELLHALHDARLLDQTADGRWRLDLPRAAAVRPLSRGVQDLILSRVEQLPAASRQLLQLTAVIGRPLEPSLLADLRPEETAVSTHVADWLARGLLRTAGDALTFTHDKIRLVLADSVPPDVRRRWHGEITRALAARHAPESAAPRLAYHAFRSDAPETALPYLRLAAEQAAAQLAFAEVAALCSQGLTLASASLDDRFTLLLMRHRAYQFLRQDAAEGENGAEMLALAREAGSADYLAQALRELSRYYFLRGRVDQARKIMRDVAGLARQTGSVHDTVRILDMVAMLHRDLTAGRAEALALLHEALALAEAAHEPVLVAMLQADLSVLLAEGGSWGAALETLSASVTALRQQQATRYLPHALYLLGGVRRAVGQHAAAAAALAEAQALCREHELHAYETQVWLEEAHLALDLAQLASATAAYERVLALAEETNRPLIAGRAFLGLGRVALRNGQMRHAVVQLSHAAGRLDPDDPRGLLLARAFLAAAFLGVDDLPAAQQQVAAVTAQIDAGTHVFTDLPHVYACAARVYQALGDGAAAEQARQAGRQEVLRQQASLPQADRAPFAAAVPIHRALLGG